MVLAVVSNSYLGPTPEHSTFRLSACLLAVLRLKLDVTIQPPRNHYPVLGHDLPGQDSHPLDYATLPGRTKSGALTPGPALLSLQLCMPDPTTHPLTDMAIAVFFYCFIWAISAKY
jgi:hypothetical protein